MLLQYEVYLVLFNIAKTNVIDFDLNFENNTVGRVESSTKNNRSCIEWYTYYLLL